MEYGGIRLCHVPTSCNENRSEHRIRFVSNSLTCTELLTERRKKKEIKLPSLQPLVGNSSATVTRHTWSAEKERKKEIEIGDEWILYTK